MEYSYKKFDELEVIVFKTREQMGKAAAEHVVGLIIEIQKRKEFVNIVFAAAPSQNEFLFHLTNSPIKWKKVNAFHMDEYIGLESDAEQLFSKFLTKNLFSKVKMNKVFLINSQAEPSKECERYSKLLEEYPTDIVCMGIGENGHIAFNDPPVANFSDPKRVKIVTLDKMCRQQQVNDGCFRHIDEVPKLAITLTIPTLISAEYLSVVVPSKTKAQAVRNTLYSKINEAVPATILRTHKKVKMFLDKESAQLI